MSIQYLSPVQIGYYNNKPITHTSSLYGKGIIIDTYFIYDKKRQQNRLRVKVEFNNHSFPTPPVFDLLDCIDKGLLILPGFENNPTILKGLENQALQAYQHRNAELNQKSQSTNATVIDSDNDNILLPKAVIQPQNQSSFRGSVVESHTSNSFDAIQTTKEKNIREKYNLGLYECTISNLFDYGKAYAYTNAGNLIHDRFSDTIYTNNQKYVQKLLTILDQNGFTFFHHHTDISNFLKIMQTCKLYSRNRAKDFKNGAELSVISHTPKFVQDSVRFYFKEKTPTFFNNEGIFSITPGEGYGNVPIPVALLFSKDLLYDKGIAITDGNAGTLKTRATISYLSALQYDWPTIFSRGPHEQDEGETTRKRNAEFLYPHELNSSKISSIVFRSEADKKHAETILGNDPRFIVNREMFTTDSSGRERNFLEDYRIRIESQRILIDLFFIKHPRGYTHLITVSFKDGEIRYYSLDDRFFSPGNTIITSIRYEKPIERLEYSLNGNVSAVWRP